MIRPPLLTPILRTDVVSWRDIREEAMSCGPTFPWVGRSSWRKTYPCGRVRAWRARYDPAHWDGLSSATFSVNRIEDAHRMWARDLIPGLSLGTAHPVLHFRSEQR